jgi:tetratricopeptide (TPR) repeat protein
MQMKGSSHGKGFQFLTDFWKLMAQNRFTEAEKLARWVVSTYPEQYLGNYLLGCALQPQGKLAAAKLQARIAIRKWRSIENTPRYPAAYNLLGLVFQNEGKFQPARKALERAVEAAPDWKDAHGQLAALLHQQGAVEDAIRVLQKGVKLIPDAHLYSYLGQLLNEAGREEEAEKSLGEAIRLAPEWAGARFDLGALRLRQQHFRDAVRLEPKRGRFRDALRGAIAMADQREFLINAVYSRLRTTIKFTDYPATKSVLYDGTNVPVIPLATPQDWEKVAARLQNVATRRAPILFRGQNQDWFSGKSLSIEPAVRRTNLSKAKIKGAIQEWRECLRPVLGELVTHRAAIEVDNKIWVPPSGHFHHAAELMYQPELGATMQHYGFPTDFLDVTPAPEVALWFALRRADKNENGAVRYLPYRWSARDSVQRWPSVYVFQPDRAQVVDLTDGMLTPTFSQRVFRQKACLISFEVFVIPPPNPERGIPRQQGAATVSLNLVMILKLKPGVLWKRLELPEGGWYFPPDDRIYQNLVNTKAILVQRYAH